MTDMQMRFNFDIKLDIGLTSREKNTPIKKLFGCLVYKGARNLVIEKN